MAVVLRSVALRTEVEVPYAEQGDPSGVPVILLHGFGDSWRSFERVFPHLPEFIHAFAFTQRGHGDAGRPAAGYGIPDFAGDLQAFMDAMDLPSAVVVGHSMGSAVALRFAIDHMDRALGLVIFGASPDMGGGESARTFWDSVVSKMSDPIDTSIIRGMTESMVVKPVPGRFLDAMVEEGLKVPASVWRKTFESRWRLEGDYSGELGRIKAPTLIIWGDQDSRYQWRQQENLNAAIAGSRMVIYEDSGHMLHWEEPERFASDLVAFTEGLV
jgi:pimeloyl-ACP methyl ester carboxylesterase